MICTYYVVISGALTLFLSSLGLVFNAIKFSHMSFLFAFLASAALVFTGKILLRNYASFLLIFLGFFFLYGLSGSFNMLFGEGLHHIFSRPYEVDIFLFNYLLSIVGLTFGILLWSSLPSKKEFKLNLTINRKLLSRLAILLAMVSSLFELINFLRVGGTSTLFLGKATYQSVVSGLSLTLPSYLISILAFSLIALACNYSPYETDVLKQIRTNILFFMLAISPIFMLTLFLGRRGPLLGWFLICLVGATYRYPVRRLSVRLIAVLFILYFCMSVIFSNRSLLVNSAKTGNWSLFLNETFSSGRIVSSLNPSSNEFGSASGNFSEFVKFGNFDYRLGETYIVALTGVMPSFIYPGDKPQQITYELRDKLFPSEKERGRIAGTGFSSILEAYMNFGPLGVVGVYFVIGIALVTLERVRETSQSINISLLYLMILPLAQVFHRSAFGSVVSSLFWAFILLIIFQILYTFFGCLPLKVRKLKR